MRVHLQGMGVQGCILARHLFRLDVDFTWDDTEQEVCAWKASTGGVYPSGFPDELRCYFTWNIWSNQSTFHPFTEKAAYWFVTKKPPHKGDFEVVNEVGKLRMGALPTIQVNVQKLVTNTRKLFSHLRKASNPKRVQIITHGYGSRLTHYKWGWSAKAELKIDKRVLKASGGMRPCLYLKQGAYSFLIYAYPVPREPELWYAGSSIIRQTTAKSLNIESKVEFWKEQIEQTGLVKVRKVTNMQEGWRPCPDERDTELVRKKKDGTLILRPMSHSGVRMAPAMVEAVLEHVGVLPRFPRLGVGRG